MTLPYQEMKEEKIQIANLTDENITTYGLEPTYIKRTPAFILPSGGTIITVPSKHISAEFYGDIEICFNLIKNINDKQLLKQKLEEFRRNILDDYYRIKKNREEITPADAAKYLEVQIQGCNSSDLLIPNLFSEEMHSVLLAIIKSKKEIYDYFLLLTNKSDNVVESLKTYPTPLIKNIFRDPTDNQFDHDTYLKFMQDFIIDSVGVDKTEMKLRDTITTTRTNPNEFYFNYKIMDYNIVQRPAVKFDEKTKTFRQIFNYNIETTDEKKYTEEIELIKKKVPYKDRYKYFL